MNMSLTSMLLRTSLKSIKSFNLPKNSHCYNNNIFNSLYLSKPTNTRNISINNKAKKMPSALLLVANGSEEMEAVITADVLRRGKINLTVAGLNSSEPVKCSQGITLVPDTSFDEALKQDYDVIILPGGLAGSEAFCASPKVGELLAKQEKAGRYLAAICAAPTAFKVHGIGRGKSITSYPSMAERFSGSDYKYVSDQAVVVDGKLVTSRGPGTAFAFGLKLVELLESPATSEQIKKAMLVQ